MATNKPTVADVAEVVQQNGHAEKAELMPSDWREQQRTRTLPPLPDTMKTFEVGFADKTPIPFKIIARPRPEHPDAPAAPEEHIFWADMNAGSGGVLALGGMIHYTATGQQQIDINAIKAFMARVLHEEDEGYIRFCALQERRDVTVEMDDLQKITSWLMEKLSGR